VNGLRVGLDTDWRCSLAVCLSCLARSSTVSPQSGSSTLPLGSYQRQTHSLPVPSRTVVAGGVSTSDRYEVLPSAPPQPTLRYHKKLAGIKGIGYE
jgi:hypothetical protein